MLADAQRLNRVTSLGVSSNPAPCSSHHYSATTTALSKSWRIDGKDAFINPLGRWSDPVAVVKSHAISAQIWSDDQQAMFDRCLMAYQPLVGGMQVGLLEALRMRASTIRQAAAIHAHKLLERYGKPICNRSEAENFLRWLREKRGLSDCTIAGLMTQLPPVQWRQSPSHFSQAQVAVAAGHSTMMPLNIYSQPTGRLKIASWQKA